MSVDQRAALEALHLLRRVVPGAVVIGRAEVARVNGLVFTVELARTVAQDTYDGVVLTVINTEAGKVHTVILTFSEHGATGDDQQLNHYNEHRVVPSLAVWGGRELEDAVRNYVQVFAG